MRHRTSLLSVSALAIVAATGPGLAADGEITSVLLSSGGLAEIVRSYDVDGAASISMTVPATQVDDVLKSVLVADPGGSVTAVSLVGSDSVAEAFRGLPFGPADLESTAAIAAAMRGFEAEVDDGGGATRRGVILGLTTVMQPSEGEPSPAPAVSLLTADGEVLQVLLGPAATLTFVDPAVRERIAEAGRALRGGKDDGAKTVRLETRGTGQRTVQVSYVAAAPVWKVSYRVIAGDEGKARVQGWAILENATGEDWNDVSVTLSSSNPVALKQRLYDMYWRQRMEAPIALPGGPVAATIDDGALARTRGQDFAESAPMAPESAAPIMDGMAGVASLATMQGLEFQSKGDTRSGISRPTQEVTAVEGDVGVRFTIPRAVDLPSGHTLSVPIIDADYKAELVSLWQPAGGSRHPVAALFVTNEAEGSVPPGIFTVFDDEGYLGDAQILGIPPGETRYAVFAADPKVGIEVETGNVDSIQSVRADRGVVTVTRRLERVTTYVAEGPATGAGRTIMIDHPRQIGWRISTDATVESETGSTLRLRGRLEPGDEAEIVVTESRSTDETVYLLDEEAEALLAWSTTEGIDAETSAKFAKIAGLRRALSAAQDDVGRSSVQIDRLAAEQSRVRQNLSFVPDTSDLAKTYLAEMADLDQKLKDAASVRDAAEGRVQQARSAYEAAIAAF
ncbi:MAG TPA: DUF4139 domain-containing protein [Methylomirabilota bacterium]|nr:DUF4139 domain-containing protein [Methylomirabilota bacterium]